MKKLLLLGGSSCLLPVIETAHKLGCYVITMDYLPNSIAHKYSDQYENVSVTDRDAVLKAANDLSIDGIMSFACDAGVVSAAYVAEKMGLPFQGPLSSVEILQDKGLFRRFLSDNGFNTPTSARFTSLQEARKHLDFFQWPIIVKPVDSAGSKGVIRIDTPLEFDQAVDTALHYSKSGAFIIEDFLTFKGFHSSADYFTINGNLCFSSFSDQLFDENADNPYVPSLIIWPSTMAAEYQEDLTGQISKLMKLLHMETGIYNIESCVGSDGKAYLMEVSPRGGGCRIAELQEYAYGVSLIEAEVRKAVGLPLQENLSQTLCKGHWCEYVVHAKPGESGVLNHISINPLIKDKYIASSRINAIPGDMVEPFTGGNMALGDIILKFSSREELDTIMSNDDEWIRIVLE